MVELTLLLCFLIVCVYGQTAGPWTCLDGIGVPVRINGDGDVECMAVDNVNCLWTSDAGCKVDLSRSASTLKPLACGAMHLKQYGGNGYDSADHWCQKARNILRYNCIPPRTFNDKGYQNKGYGWYDYLGQGCCNDYCRYVGDFAQNWFSCAVAGGSTEYTPVSLELFETKMAKCSMKGAVTSVSLPPRGAPGPAGTPGGVGPAGAYGPPGAPGAAGKMGPPGPEGPRGAKGAVGDPGDNGYKGAPGAAGVQGPIGPPGPAGADGVTGPPGPAGKTPPRGSPMPAPGKQGAEGYPGATGTTGPTGNTGPIGATGDIGVDGAKGPPGATGPVGGTGITGIQGDKGLIGDAGVNGDKGAIGDAGPIGVNGPIGDTGPIGVPGAPGGDGVNGATGPVGPIGDTGVAGTPVDAEQIKANVRKNADVLTDDVISKVEWPQIPAKQLPSDEVLDKVIGSGLQDLSYIKLSKKVQQSLENSNLENELADIKNDISRLKRRIEYAERAEKRRRIAERQYQEALAHQEPLTPFDELLNYNGN